ncbi:MAG: hypothetical protein JWN38_181 [Candidatus Saccharibacteria bacterium]|nr:hypothetical protein [Candidatus Saccharibacteria bacterium]
MNHSQIYLIIIVVVAIIIATVLILLAFQRLLVAISTVRLQVARSVEPKFLEISPETNNLVDLAIEVWRLQKRLEKAQPDLKDDQAKALQNSQAKLVRYLDRNDVKVTDYTDQKYNEGMNLEVLAVEKDATLKQAVIKETHEPAVTLKGKLIRKAKVILLEP